MILNLDDKPHVMWAVVIGSDDARCPASYLCKSAREAHRLATAHMKQFRQIAHPIRVTVTATHASASGDE